MNELVKTEDNTQLVQSGAAVLEPAKFARMKELATIMAGASLIPDSLKGSNPEQTFSNCFMVACQADRWGMDPLAVAQCVSLVHGKMMYEGKLVAAAIEKTIGVTLDYEWNDASGDAFGITVSHTDHTGKRREITGTVGDWKTDNRMWKSGGAETRKMLAYRGAREWARLYAPSVILGVYSPDEFDQDHSAYRASRARDVTPGSMAERYQPDSSGTPIPEEKDSPEAVTDEQSGRAMVDGGSEFTDEQIGHLKAFWKDAVDLMQSNPNMGGAEMQKAIAAMAQKRKGDDFKDAPDHVTAQVKSLLAGLTDVLKGNRTMDDVQAEVSDLLGDE